MRLGWGLGGRLPPPGTTGARRAPKGTRDRREWEGGEVAPPPARGLLGKRAAARARGIVGKGPGPGRAAARRGLWVRGPDPGRVGG